MTTSGVSSTSSTTSSLSTAQSQTAVDDPADTGLTESEYIDPKLEPYIDDIDEISNSIDANVTKTTAYQDMQTDLQSLASAAQDLAGVDGQSSDAFSSRTASLSSSSSTSADDILSVSVADGTSTGTHTVVVTQLAAAEQIASSGQSSESNALDFSGTFTIGAGSGSSTISIDDNMSLSDIAQAINDTTSSSDVSASIVEVNSTDYVLEIKASGDDESIVMSSGSNGVLYSLGLTSDDGSTAANVVQQAQAAELTVDGISGITRDSNTISDVISGVTLDLTSASPGSTVTLDVEPDTDSVTNAIDAFVSAYNTWASFVAANSATTSDGTASSSATLFGDATMTSADTAIQNALSSLVDNSSLGAIGISLNTSNQLSVNSTELASALSDNFSTVQSLFEFQASSSDDNLTLAADSGSAYSGSFTLNITTNSDGSIASVSGTDSSSGDPVDFTIDGDELVGASGSPYAGLTFAYNGGTTSSPITVTVSQGIGDAVYQTANKYGNSTDGIVQTQVNNLTDDDSTLESNLSSTTDQAENYYNFLLDQYGQIESQIASANETTTLLEDLMADENSSS